MLLTLEYTRGLVTISQRSKSSGSEKPIVVLLIALIIIRLLEVSTLGNYIQQYLLPVYIDVQCSESFVVFWRLGIDIKGMMSVQCYI